ncbi:MAG TPA: MBOAT family protein, partial [Clostridiales bacterium]|nr:MBOAT family protein [Clostridiales bacterium]
MLFTSYEFLLFLIVLIMVYYAIPKKFQWLLLLIASYIFYAYAGVHYIIYIIGTTLTTYIASININKLQLQQAEYVKNNRESLSREERKAYRVSMKKKQRTWMVLCLVFNFGVLAVLKYTDFALSNVNSLFTTFGVDKELPFFRFALPLGISFYTFQTMGYIIDIYREKYSYEKNIFRLGLFVSFFPQLIQGPISRFDDLKKTLFSEHSIDWVKISYGLQRILWGYFKKLVIADRLLVGVTTIVGNPQEYQGVYVLLGMFFYAIDLYCDFTGGIDIVIGIAQVLGIDVAENFIRPYFSKSVTEYWRRWHITLGTWFKDYIFYPLSISKSMLNFSKKSRKWLGNGIGKR